ncbi:uncharacterized protein NPIL_148271 [Nephila pilipes]|uniref:Uncharacterized protein n=1 Tax=Nephila pilipes TaxID=299642 RepID=A0A8X6SZ30_NEPPI|nr:uncharacterized protein NPIL_148271 [Nephila pilipes]
MINSVPFLEHLALVKIGLKVYNDPDVQIFEKNEERYLADLPTEKWEFLIQKKLSNIGSCVKIQKRIFGLMKPLSNEVSMWKEEHLYIEELYSRENPFPFFWKENGTIDRIKTARNIIRSENFCYPSRFETACIYWMEEDIKKLWEEMPSDCAESYNQWRVCSYCPVNKHIIAGWIDFIGSETENWRDYSFEHSLSWYCNDGGALQGQLFQNLSPSERSEVFSNVMEDEDESELCTNKRSFCISQMNRNEMKEMFSKEPLAILTAVFQWPRQVLFAELEEKIFTTLSEKDFCHLLHHIICLKIKPDWNDFYYEGVLRDLWERSPDHFKKYIEESKMFNFFMKALNHNYNTRFEEPCPCSEQLRELTEDLEEEPTEDSEEESIECTCGESTEESMEVLEEDPVEEPMEHPEKLPTEVSEEDLEEEPMEHPEKLPTEVSEEDLEEEPMEH